MMAVAVDYVCRHDGNTALEAGPTCTSARPDARTPIFIQHALRTRPYTAQTDPRTGMSA